MTPYQIFYRLQAAGRLRANNDKPHAPTGLQL